MWNGTVYYFVGNATWRSFGEGCMGTVGVPTFAPAMGSLPQLGSAFTVEVGGLPMTPGPAFALAGASKTTWGPFALPYDLSIIGATGCSLLVSPQLTASAASAGGIASLVFPIPNSPVLIGVPVFLQGAAIDLGANPLGSIVSTRSRRTWACRPGHVTRNPDAALDPADPDRFDDLAREPTMPGVLESSLPYLPAVLLPLLLLLLAPIRESTGRGRIAAAFALGAAAMVVLAIRQAPATATLDVLNPFPTGADQTPTLFVTERVTAPGWHWPLAAAVVFAALALGTFAAVRRPARAPGPVFYCLFAGTLVLAVRLAFEKTAAPLGLVWATGTTPAQLLILWFLGVYVAHRGWSFGRFFVALLVLAALQRAVITLVGFVATINAWGTHLDVNQVTHLNTPLGGMRTFGPDQAVDKWVWAILVPQMALWVLITLVLGLILGGIAFRLNRR